jgi:hypothetical protein
MIDWYASSMDRVNIRNLLGGTGCGLQNGSKLEAGLGLLWVGEGSREELLGGLVLGLVRVAEEVGFEAVFNKESIDAILKIRDTAFIAVLLSLALFEGMGILLLKCRSPSIFINVLI